MKYMIASDIHGSAFYCRKLLEAFEESGANRLVLLGDILYHGPRNDLPKEYAPKEVLAMLNGCKDQMVLEFPVMADYALLAMDGITIYATHGHVYHENHLPPMQKGDVLLHGHTHVLRADRCGDITILNPGSVSIPKEGNPPTYAILEDRIFRILDFEGCVIKEKNLGE